MADSVEPKFDDGFDYIVKLDGHSRFEMTQQSKKKSRRINWKK